MLIKSNHKQRHFAYWQERLLATVIMLVGIVMLFVLFSATKAMAAEVVCSQSAATKSKLRNSYLKRTDTERIQMLNDFQQTITQKRELAEIEARKNTTDSLLLAANLRAEARNMECSVDAFLGR